MQIISPYPSIHLLSLPVCRGSCLSRKAQISLTPATSSTSSTGTRESWVCPGPPPCRTHTSARRHSGGILVRCPNLLNWLPLMWRSHGSTLISSFMAESLRESPDTFQRKLTSVTLILIPTLHNELWTTPVWAEGYQLIKSAEAHHLLKAEEWPCIHQSGDLPYLAMHRNSIHKNLERVRRVDGMKDQVSPSVQGLNGSWQQTRYPVPL